MSHKQRMNEVNQKKVITANAQKLKYNLTNKLHRR